MEHLRGKDISFTTADLTSCTAEHWRFCNYSKLRSTEVIGLAKFGKELELKNLSFKSSNYYRDKKTTKDPVVDIPESMALLWSYSHLTIFFLSIVNERIKIYLAFIYPPIRPPQYTMVLLEMELQSYLELEHAMQAHQGFKGWIRAYQHIRQSDS